MSEPAAVPVKSTDAAWASFNTPLDPQSLRSFCSDIERLFRINPMLEFSKWQALGGDRYLFAGRNISQEEPFEFEFELQVRELADGYHVDYTNSLKSSTTFKIEPAKEGSKLTIVDNYEGLSEEIRKSRSGEVDRSLTVWAEYLQKFLFIWQRWSRFGLWRWYMRRVWQPMKPTGRRITFILLAISLVEVALIALGAAIFFIEFA